MQITLYKHYILNDVQFRKKHLGLLTAAGPPGGTVVPAYVPF